VPLSAADITCFGTSAVLAHCERVPLIGFVASVMSKLIFGGLCSDKGVVLVKIALGRVVISDVTTNAHSHSATLTASSLRKNGYSHQ
jgi:hypothetical protein